MVASSPSTIKSKVEELGLLKMDFLGLRTLTVIGDCIRFIRETTGEEVDIDNIAASR